MEYINVRGLDKPVPKLIFGTAWFSLDAEEEAHKMMDLYVEKGGKLSLSGYQFKNVDHLMRIIERIVTPLGRRIDTSSPMVDARLADGSRVNAIIPPLAADAPCLTIRKFGKKIFTCDMLLKFSSLTEDMVEFAQACVMARKNIVVSGNVKAGIPGGQMGQHGIGVVRRQHIVVNVAHQHHQIGRGSVDGIQKLPLSRAVITAVQIGEAGNAHRPVDLIAFHGIYCRFQIVIPTQQHKQQDCGQQQQEAFFQPFHTAATPRRAISSRSLSTSAG